MAREPSALEIQRELVNMERAKRLVEERQNKVDIRQRIAKSGWWDPSKDDPDTSYHTEYPKWVYPEGAGTGGLIVQNRDEEHKVMGTKPAPAKPVTVDIADLGQQQPVPVQAKRGRPPKAKAAELPANLD